MAYDYNKAKQAYQSLSKEQQRQYVQQNQNDANFQRFMNDYMNEINGRTNTVANPTPVNNPNPNIVTNTPNDNINTPKYTYWDTWWAANATKYTGTGVSSAWDYKYNQNLTTWQLNGSSMLFGTNAENYESRTPWYLEQRNNAIANALYNEWRTDYDSIYNYLMTFDDFKNYDDIGRKNTATAIQNRIGSMASQYNNNWYNQNADDLNSRLMSEIWNNYNNWNKWYSDLMGWGSYPQDFDEAVKQKLKTAYGISNLDEFKSRYPEQYNSLVQSLESVRWVRDATDPNSRQMLDWALQWIIGTWVGAWSDWSKLSVLEESVLNKFKNPDQIKQDAQNVIKLQTEWYNTADIADRMWISEDQVQQLILLANGLDSKAWEYYQLKSDVAKDITEPYNTKMERLEEEKKIALDRANRNVEWLKTDFDTNMERQKQQNDINLHNADFLAWQYWYWMSRRGIEWLNYTATQAQNIIDDLTKNYDRNNQQMADGIADIIRNWQWNNDDLMKASQDALTKAKNNFTSSMLAIQQQYGTVWLQAQQYLSQNVQSFIEQAESIYDNALTRQQQNLSNLITNVSNLNALAAQNLTLRQAKIQQFQSEAMTMNRSQLQQLANQLWMSSEEYGDLVNYQAQAVANELNGYVPWAWIQFQDEINTMLESGANAQEVLQRVMNQPNFKAMQQAANWTQDKWAMSNWIMYNQATWEYKNLNQDEYWTVWNNIYNKRTWEVITVDWNTVSTTDANWNYQKVKLWEQATDTWIPNVYGSTVKLAPTVWKMLQSAYDTLAAQWIQLQIWDSYRSYETQKKAYEEDQAKPANQRKWVAKPWTSYHELGQAIDIAQNQMNDPAVIQAMLDAGFTRPVSSEPRHWSYGEWKDMFWWTPSNSNMSDYDINTAVMKIWRQAYWANISNSESERVEKVVKDWASMWKSQTEILYDILWMKITNNKDSAEPFIDIMVQNSDKDWLSAYNVQWFADFINKWKNVEAMNLVEQAVAKERWGNFSSDMAKYEKWAKYLYTKWNDIINLINDQTNKLWIVAGNFENKWTKFVKDEEFQTLKSSLANLVADWRHDMIWSAATETELKMLEDLIPVVTDNPYNAIKKIEELQDKWLRDYNGVRWNLYLPSVNSESLLDKNKRVQLYLWGNTPTVQGRWNIGAWSDMTSRVRQWKAWNK